MITTLKDEGMDLVKAFFEKRFKRKFDVNDPYCREWIQRFETGAPYIYMDYESRRAYIAVQNERIKAFGGMGRSKKKLRKLMK